ncbi:hypothetical protein HanHA300_Chr17g0653281 [Helianthus annuus]|nr:hypothetical protein HanHA300_Chr17g0653281 [Helianthus annuus]KAJ0447411.1 hypothetical protein HanHA89_Chr17g0705091 [Helianthus annuus]KAJ0632290.1 hypothetical protein HanLR1_Chr17g0663491 [Helianthus annuus]
MGQVGELFGKVLHVPKSFEEDQDLSMARVGVLVGHSSKIKDEVILKWKNRSFRIWVKEDHEVWVPDCLRRLSDSVSEGNPSSDFSLVDDMQLSGDGEFVENQASEGTGVAEKSPGGEVPSSHADTSKVHGEKGCNATNTNEEREFMPFVIQGCQLKSVGVGPEVAGVFKSGSGEKVGRPRRRYALGQRSSKSQAHLLVNNSSVAVRPKKRSRGLVEDDVPGFGFVGFTSRLGTPLDLNSLAPSSESSADDSQHLGSSIKDQNDGNQNQGNDVEKEIEATINIGAQVGVEFGQKVKQASKIIGSSGINVVKS